MFNFEHERKANPSPLQLTDGSEVAGALLTCGSAASHAAYGRKDIMGTVETQYLPLEKLPWNTFKITMINRGDVLGLHGGSGELFIHYQTASQTGIGAGVDTYAADYRSHKFRRELVRDYYVLFWDSEHNPASLFFEGYEDKANDFGRWFGETAEIWVYRKP